MKRSALLVAATIVIVVAGPSGALAEELSIGADFDAVRASDPEPTSGFGLGFRIGPRLHVPLLVVNPEIGGSYARFESGDVTRLYRGTAGLRIAVGELIRPGVFLHLGAGRLIDSTSAQAADHTRTAFTWDAGGSLDLTFLPLVDVGAHAAWGNLAGRDAAPSFGWLILGLHAALIL